MPIESLPIPKRYEPRPIPRFGPSFVSYRNPLYHSLLSRTILPLKEAVGVLSVVEGEEEGEEGAEEEEEEEVKSERSQLLLDLGQRI